jgi:hypothetical protein
MKRMTPRRGGARPGAGRKPIAEGERLRPTTVTLTEAQREKLKRLGGSPWVRKKIDGAKE